MSFKNTPIDISQIRLLPGSPFYERQLEMNEFLLSQDPDSILYNFRAASGLPTCDAAPMTGWDSDECKLKGHTTGHYMSGLALAYAATGDDRFRDRLSYIVTGLRECRDAFALSGKTAPGFLSAYDEEQFDLLEQYTKYPEIWAPYYTLDKIMSGLLDAYELAGITEALDILAPLGDWVYARLSRMPEDQRNKMWSMYIAGEYGVMISSMIRVYRLTGQNEHLAAAGFFENPALFHQMEEGRDDLDTMHANQHIPQIMGAVELYRETREEKYFEIAKNFWGIVTRHHCYSIGGTGEEERWHAADSASSYLTDKTAESCASYNMLRLTSLLHEEMLSGNITLTDNGATNISKLMDYYELTLFNHILMSCSHASDGGTTYFLPLAPGSTKHYETEENSCCHGTGMESRYRYMSQIYSYSGEDLVLINLPIPSRLDGEERITLNVDLTISGNMDLTVSGNMDSNECETDMDPEPTAPVVSVGSSHAMTVDAYTPSVAIIRITAECRMKRRLALRIPHWAMNGDHSPRYRIITESVESVESVESFDISGNVADNNNRENYTFDDWRSVTIGHNSRLGSYFILEDVLQEGEILEIGLPMELRVVESEAEHGYSCLAYGPFLLAAISGSKETLLLSEVIGGRRISLDNGSVHDQECSDPIALVPLYQVDKESYHIYFRSN